MNRNVLRDERDPAPMNIGTVLNDAGNTESFILTGAHHVFPVWSRVEGGEFVQEYVPRHRAVELLKKARDANGLKTVLAHLNWRAT